MKKNMFLCDNCGKKKTGVKFKVFDENFKKQKGVFLCEECYKKILPH